MVTTLVYLFRHNRWANLCLLASCAALDPEQLAARPAGGTFGSIEDTLGHNEQLGGNDMN